MALANTPSIISELNYSPPETDTGFDPEDPGMNLQPLFDSVEMHK